MKHKTLALISIALTVFSLILIAGVMTAVRRVSAADEPAVATQDPAVLQYLNERETAYQEMIAQANQRLLEAQQAQDALQAQLDASQSDAAADTTSAAISPQQAAELAAVYMGQSDLYAVENTAMSGQPAYLVTFSSGDQVYVGLDGQVLGVVPAQQITTGSQSSASNSGFREHEDHEAGEHAEHGEHDD